ncbi:MAG: hypothetical protein CVT83_01365 [Alphaproteobacteria bacterium HGW-Alphaproteobacteria-5]|nr:MAG: hypothetical protein CVT83_01365 [Alphaproteobacteria bacterium HGW-Alphaproteobacteria-5]
MTDFKTEKEVTVTDPVCGMRMTLEKAAAQQEHAGCAYFFCSNACREVFLAAPERYSSSRFQVLPAQVDEKP